MPLRLLPIAIDVPATMLSVERKAMAKTKTKTKTKMTMWGASAERLGEGSRVAVPVDATVPRALPIALEYATREPRAKGA